MADQNDLTTNVTLYDEAGNQVGVILDGIIYRLQVDSKSFESFSDPLDAECICAEGTILSGAEVQFLVANVPSDKDWWMSGWSVTGEKDQEATCSLLWYDTSSVTDTLVDGFEATTGWAETDDVDSIALDATTQTQGSNSLKCEVDFGGKGKGSGTIVKSFTLDISTESSILIDAKTDLTRMSLTIEIHEGANSYIFGYQTVDSDWESFTFNLNEVTGVDLTAIDDITIHVEEDEDEEGFFWVDNLRTQTAPSTHLIDKFKLPLQTDQRWFKPFRRVVGSDSDISLRVIIENTDAGDGLFVATMQGISIDQ